MYVYVISWLILPMA